MLTCEHCQERLLDHAYGLLEGADLQETLAHLDACPECQAAWVEVQSQKKLMGRAARAITQVPEFTLPSEKTAETAVIAPVQPAPFGDNAPPRRSPWRRPWIAWVVAASVLFAVTAPVVWYRSTVARYQSEVAAARTEVKEIELALASLPAKYEPMHAKTIKDARAAASPYLHVVGPKTLPPNAKGRLHITTRHPEGELAACNLRIKLVEAKTGKVIMLDSFESPGHADADFDTAGAEPNSDLNLLVEADTAHGKSQLPETLHVEAPAYVTRIDTNKTLYQMKDVLFFRVLVLDRHTLQPPAAAIPLRVSLVHDQKPLRFIERTTGPGGILAAEFAVQENYPEGSYSLEVRPVDPGKTNVQPASMPLEFVRALPDIRLDQARYLPGATVTGDLTFRGGKAVPEKIDAKFDGEGKSIPVNVRPQAAAAGFGGGANLGGNANNGPPKAAPQARFSAPIPAAVPPGANHVRMTLLWAEGKQKKEARTLIPLAPTEFAIDFFPEGGNLIAGVPNRVFYRVRSKTGEPIAGDGRVILLSSKNDIVDSNYQLGMGQFDFTPAVKETYTVRITTPFKVENIAEPFKKLGGIRPEGVVLHVEKAVGKQNDPICVSLRQHGPPRKLLLVAHCRGEIVDQRWVEIAPPETHIALQPAPETRGMIRVTAYEAAGKALEAIAERLIYRAPTQTLQLAFTPNLQQVQPGSAAHAKIAAKDENGQPAQAWILASVVDERFQAPPSSLSAHFLLLNEIRTGADLDNAQIVLNDAPASAQMLERFLGTHGWRRYVPVQGPAQEAQAAPEIVFSHENMPMEKLQKNYEKKIAAALVPIHARADEEQKQLEAVRLRRVSAVQLLVDQLGRFEEQVQLWIRLGLGVAVALLLAASLVLMGSGAYRLVRAHKVAAPSFGAAFACLAACLGIVFVGEYLDPIQDAPRKGHAVAEAKNQHQLDQLARGPQLKDSADKIPTGTYGLRRSANDVEQQINEMALGNKKDEAGAAPSLQGQQMVMNLFARDRADASNLAAPPITDADAKMQERYEAARDGAADANKGGKAKGAEPIPLAPGSAPNMHRAIEYPYFFANGGASDTLLWHPTLWLAAGNGAVHFDIPQASATYRVILLGHAPTGRFGFFETRLDVPAFQGR